MKKGDFVFYSNPEAIDGAPNNVVTVVLEATPERDTCIIWWQRTTALVFKRNCTILPVHRGAPIMVPTAPWAATTWMEDGSCCRSEDISLPGSVLVGRQICSPGNQADFQPVPLEYFGYGLKVEGRTVSLETPVA